MNEIVKSILNDHSSILGNIEWNLGGLVGLATIIIEPKVISLQNAPRVINIDGLEIDGFQCYGLSLKNIERKDRSNEIINAAKRSLICESLEIIAENMARVARIINGGDDPLATNDYFNADIRELWNGNDGKSGSLLSDAERQYFELCTAPLRNWIRHNNGKIPNNKSIEYSGSLAGKQIDINQQWVQGNDNNLNVLLSDAYNIFYSNREISINAINSAVGGDDA